jgi:hypothetical protein
MRSSVIADPRVVGGASQALTPTPAGRTASFGGAVIEGQNVELLVISDSQALPLLDANRPLQQHRSGSNIRSTPGIVLTLWRMLRCTGHF